MAVFGISDLHLTIANPEKDMAIFGELWKNHTEKLLHNWNRIVSEEDVILVSGDISWALRYEEAEKDIDFLKRLKGTKIFVRGNHDYWWRRKASSKINSHTPDNMIFLQGKAVCINDIWFTGTRGWRIENGTSKENSLKIFDRESEYLREGLRSIPSDSKYKIAMLHFPPFDEDFKFNVFAQILREYKVDMLVYGHIHMGEYMDGNINGVEYKYTSADFLDFNPRLLI